MEGKLTPKSVFLFIAFLPAILSVVVFCTEVAKWAGTPWSSDNVYIETYSETKHFDITRRYIRKELGVEDMHLFELGGYNIEFSLSEPDYERLVGSGSNSVKTDIYEVRVLVPLRGFFRYENSIARAVTMRRFSFVGQEPFTDDEIVSIGELVLGHLNNSARDLHRSALPSEGDLELALDAPPTSTAPSCPRRGM